LSLAVKYNNDTRNETITSADMLKEKVAMFFLFILTLKTH
jgi:hypothetical protein